MNRILMWIGIFLLLIPFGSGATLVPGDLKVITEDYAPLNYLDNGTLKGISVELTEAILSRMGSNITRNSFTVLPWSDGYNIARTTPDTILLTTDRLAERENLFLWAGPIIPIRQVLFTRSEENHSATSDISTLRIVTLTDDCAKSYAIAAGADKKKMTDVLMARDAIRMVENGTVDAWAYNEIAGKRDIDAYAENPDQFKVMKDIGLSRFYLAFNLDTPVAFVDAVNTTIQEIKRNRAKTGVTEYEQIVARYLPLQCAEISPDKTRVMDLVNQTAADLAVDASGTIAAIHAGESPYRDPVDPELYVFVFDTSVNLKANAANTVNTGKNLAGTTDVYGKLFRDQMVQGAVQNGTGWVSYVYSNPESLGIYQKMSYYTLVTGSDGVHYVVGAGRYLTCDESEKSLT